MDQFSIGNKNHFFQIDATTIENTEFTQDPSSTTVNPTLCDEEEGFKWLSQAAYPSLNMNDTTGYDAEEQPMDTKEVYVGLGWTNEDNAAYDIESHFLSNHLYKHYTSYHLFESLENLSKYYYCDYLNLLHLTSQLYFVTSASVLLYTKQFTAQVNLHLPLNAYKNSASNALIQQEFDTLIQNSFTTIETKDAICELGASLYALTMQRLNNAIEALTSQSSIELLDYKNHLLNTWDAMQKWVVFLEKLSFSKDEQSVCDKPSCPTIKKELDELKLKFTQNAIQFITDELHLVQESVTPVGEIVTTEINDLSTLHQKLKAYRDTLERLSVFNSINDSRLDSFLRTFNASLINCLSVCKDFLDAKTSSVAKEFEETLIACHGTEQYNFSSIKNLFYHYQALEKIIFLWDELTELYDEKLADLKIFYKKFEKCEHDFMTVIDNLYTVIENIKSDYPYYPKIQITKEIFEILKLIKTSLDNNQPTIISTTQKKFLAIEKCFQTYCLRVQAPFTVKKSHQKKKHLDRISKEKYPLRVELGKRKYKAAIEQFMAQSGWEEGYHNFIEQCQNYGGLEWIAKEKSSTLQIG